MSLPLPPLFAALRQSLRSGYSWRSLRNDLGAGLTVGIVAIPLAMALAIAVGVAPQHGLYGAGGRPADRPHRRLALQRLRPHRRLRGHPPADHPAVRPRRPAAVHHDGRDDPHRHGPGALRPVDPVHPLPGDPGLHRRHRHRHRHPAGQGPAGPAAGAPAAELRRADRPAGPGAARCAPGRCAGGPGLPGRPAGVAAPGAQGAGAPGSPGGRRPAGPRPRTHGPAGGHPGRTLHLRTGRRGAPGHPAVAAELRLALATARASGAPLVLSFELVRQLLAPAFAIAMLGAIESLLCAVVSDGMAGTRHDPNAELLGRAWATWSPRCSAASPPPPPSPAAPPTCAPAQSRPSRR